MGNQLAAVVVPIAPPATETLLLVAVQRAGDDSILLQSIWATTTDVRRGHRRTDIERIYTSAALLLRLNELSPRLFHPAATDRVGQNGGAAETAKLAVNR